MPVNETYYPTNVFPLPTLPTVNASANNQQDAGSASQTDKTPSGDCPDIIRSLTTIHNNKLRCGVSDQPIDNQAPDNQTAWEKLTGFVQESLQTFFGGLS